MESMILARWDVIHRSIRDVKLSLLHGAGGEFYQAQFHSQYLFSMAYRPYGSSGFFEDKKRLLEMMMAREGPDTVPMFVDSWEKIRDEIGLPSTATMTDTWNALPNLDGFRTKANLAQTVSMVCVEPGSGRKIARVDSSQVCACLPFLMVMMALTLMTLFTKDSWMPWPRNLHKKPKERTWGKSLANSKRNLVAGSSFASTSWATNCCRWWRS